MSEVSPEAAGGGVLAAIAGAIVRYVIVPAWHAHQERKRYRKVDDMADSARFAAIEERVGSLAMQFDSERLAWADERKLLLARIDELEQRVAQLGGDLYRSTSANAALERRYDATLAELDELRREVHGAAYQPVRTPRASEVAHAIPDESTPVHSRAGRAAAGSLRALSPLARARPRGPGQGEGHDH